MTILDMPGQVQSILGKYLFKMLDIRDRERPKMTDDEVYSCFLNEFEFDCHHIPVIPILKIEPIYYSGSGMIDRKIWKCRICDSIIVDDVYYLSRSDCFNRVSKEEFELYETKRN